MEFNLSGANKEKEFRTKNGPKMKIEKDDKNWIHAWQKFKIHFRAHNKNSDTFY